VNVARGPEDFEGDPQSAEAGVRIEGTTVTPIAATLKILLTSVPYLIGAAVVRHGPSGNAAIASVGRVPWLHDRRLISIDLPGDQLPANRAVLLDWPVPHQAEWVGAPPRLIVARLVAFERTVGVLLGTLITREPLPAQAREALGLSCQLIASAVATDTLVHAAEQQSRRLRLLNEVQQKLSSTLDARQLGRIVRDAVGEVADIAAFALSLFHAERDEVAYRYRVADLDALASELSRPALGPSSPELQQGERWVRYETEVEVPLSGNAAGRLERRTVTVLQVPMLSRGVPIAVVTLHTFRPGGFTEEQLDLVLGIVDAAANYFAHARQLGRFQVVPESRAGAPSDLPATGTPEPLDVTPDTATSTSPENLPAAVPPIDVARAASPQTFEVTPGAGVSPRDGDSAPLAASELGEASDEARETAPIPAALDPAQSISISMPGPDELLRGIIRRCVDVGLANVFVMLADAAAGLLRGHSTSGSEPMRYIDDATGLARGMFVIAIDDRLNAIARACREGRALQVASAHELLGGVVQSEDALVLERLVGGGHAAVLPVLVEGEVVAALVLGPYPEAPSAESVEAARAFVNEAARHLREARLRAIARGETPASIVSEGTALRLRALRSPT